MAWVLIGLIGVVALVIFVIDRRTFNPNDVDFGSRRADHRVGTAAALVIVLVGLVVNLIGRVAG